MDAGHIFQLSNISGRFICCGSLSPVLVSVLVTFHVVFLHFIFSSVYVVEWPTFQSVDHNIIFLYFDYLLFKLFPVLVLRARFRF